MRACSENFVRATVTWFYDFVLKILSNLFFKPWKDRVDIRDDAAKRNNMESEKRLSYTLLTSYIALLFYSYELTKNIHR